MRRFRERAVEAELSTQLLEDVRSAALPLGAASDLEPLRARIGNARYVLLGEASHGTSEFYSWRAAISKQLIEEHGVCFVAVEGDWPDCYRINRYVKGLPDSGESAEAVLREFRRWPTWMWANREVLVFVEWLRGFNQGRPPDRRVGFYGLDVYSLWESLELVMAYAQRLGPQAAAAARRAYQCFEPYAQDMTRYARASRFVDASCEDEVVALLATLRARAPAFAQDGDEEFFAVEQGALVVREADRYYRTMMAGGPESWNVRDQHMVQTLERLMRRHGPDARGIVWEHNTHIGDARYTDMAAAGMVNVGQLVREAHEPDDVVLIGFGTHRGTMIAGAEWDAPMERMPVPAARAGSWEHVLHRAAGADKLLIFEADPAAPPRLVTEEMLEWRGHRAIGVVYDPDMDAFGNYVASVLPKRYDAFLFIDETRALRPLHVPALDDAEPPLTFPFRV